MDQAEVLQEIRTMTFIKTNASEDDVEQRKRMKLVTPLLPKSSVSGRSSPSR